MVASGEWRAIARRAKFWSPQGSFLLKCKHWGQEKKRGEKNREKKRKTEEKNETKETGGRRSTGEGFFSKKERKSSFFFLEASFKWNTVNETLKHYYLQYEE